MQIGVKIGTLSDTDVVNQHIGRNFAAYCGDSMEVIKGIPDNSIGISIWSPPFANMYIYSNTPRDAGNAKTTGELIEHLSFLLPDLLRVTMPGRSCWIHICEEVTYKKDGEECGVRDTPGDIVRAMVKHGWTSYGRTVIAKDPQVKAIRTKDRGLLFKSLANDSANCHMALNDYFLQFRKPGVNPYPIRAGISTKYNNPNGWVTDQEWITWACGVWDYRLNPSSFYEILRNPAEPYSLTIEDLARLSLGPWMHRSAVNPDGIQETNVLNVRQARAGDDERHLCPLQLDAIYRTLMLGTNPGDTVLSPFMGIGSEGWQALINHRKFIGIELNEGYFGHAVNNLTEAERQASAPDLFSWMEEQVDEPDLVEEFI